MKRRIFTLLTTVCLILTSVLGSSQVALADTTFTAPQIGDEISGFTVKETTFDQSTKSNNIILEHDKTGAKVLVINNNDVNRGFSIKFNTPPDDKGVNHILEHSVLGGSSKYPTKNSVFDLVNTTYLSFVNAMTYTNMTLFPICSQSEAQLYKSTDTYLSYVFDPLLITDQRIFEREGWRYELTDESSPLTYNGIVYNEMQGSMGNITSAAITNANKAIFTDTDQGNNSGGMPSDILTLSYEELMDAYNKYYHPSNSFIVLYGDLDYKRFLNMIDTNYLSLYSKKEIDIPRFSQKPSEQLVEKTYSFPVAENAATENKAVIDLVFATEDIKALGMENYKGLSLAVDIMNQETSEMMKAMKASQIAESYVTYLDNGTFQPTIHFIALNADASRSKDFYNLVMKELKKVVDNGVDNDLVESSLRSNEFEEMIDNDSAINEMIYACFYDHILDNPFADDISYTKAIADKLDENILEDIIRKHLIDNKLVALTVTKPEAGLLEKNYMKLMQDLDEKKASMTDEEIQALIEKTAQFNAWNSETTSDDVLSSLRAVDLKDISIDMREYEIEESTIDGVNLWSTQADVDEISMVQLDFDLSHLDKEELLYLQFYNDILNSGISTENRSEAQVVNDIANKLYSMNNNIAVYTEDEEDSSAYPVYTVSYYSLEDEYKDTFDLVYDILLQSDIENISTYGMRAISNIKTNYELQLANPISIMALRCLAYTSDSYRIYNYINGLDYYDFILSLEKELDSNPKDVYYKLLAVRSKALTYNKNNMNALYAGDGNALDKFKDAMPTFTGKFIEGSFSDSKYEFSLPARREAISINSQVQYVCVNASLSENEVPNSAKGNVISVLLNNLMLVPEIRLKGGAYGVSASFSDYNYFVVTQQDTNFVNTLNIIGATDEFLTAITPYITEDILDSYLLSLLGSFNQSYGEINDAMNALLRVYQGNTNQELIDYIEEMKETNVSDITKYSEYLARINENLNYIIAASPEEIEKNKEMFDSILVLQ